MFYLEKLLAKITLLDDSFEEFEHQTPHRSPVRGDHSNISTSFLRHFTHSPVELGY